MSTSPTHARPTPPPAARMLLLALALLCGVAPPAAAQRRTPLAQRFRMMVAQLRMGLGEEPAAARNRPEPLKPCWSLYNPEIRRIAQGPELAWSHTDWIKRSYAVIGRSGHQPLPLCFEPGRDTLTTRQGHWLLRLNNHYLRSRDSLQAPTRFFSGYVLTGYTDPAEKSAKLARARAEWTQAQSPLPHCRYLIRLDTGETAAAYHRRVYYSYQPAVAGCPRTSY